MDRASVYGTEGCPFESGGVYAAADKHNFVIITASKELAETLLDAFKLTIELNGYLEDELTFSREYQYKPVAVSDTGYSAEYVKCKAVSIAEHVAKDMRRCSRRLSNRPKIETVKNAEQYPVLNQLENHKPHKNRQPGPSEPD